MYAYLAKKTNKSVDRYFDTYSEDKDEFREQYDVFNDKLMYWRKNRHLHNYMENLYEKLGGKKEFNCVKVVLDLDDIIGLEKDIRRGIVEKLDTTGFFYGNNDYDEFKEDDLKFCKKAKELLQSDNRYVIVYDSWW